MTNGPLCTCRESAVTHKCFGSENIDPAGAGRWSSELPSPLSFLWGVVAVLRGCRYHSVSGLLSYGVRSTPAPRAPCHASEWKGAAHPVLPCVLFSQADQRCRVSEEGEPLRASCLPLMGICNLLLARFRGCLK